MTGYSQGGYVVSASNPDSGSELVWKYYDNDNSTFKTFGNYYNGGSYNRNPPTNHGGNVLSGDAVPNGEWHKIEMPHRLKLNSLGIRPRNSGNAGEPVNWSLYGSNDDVNWTMLYKKTDSTVPDDALETQYPVNATSGFSYFLIVMTSSAGYTYLNVSEFNWYGHRENDLVRLPDPTNVLEYPHITMTGFAQRGYEVSASSTYTPDYQAWKMFADDDASNPSPYGGFGWWLSPQTKYRTSTPFEYLGGTTDNLGTYTGSSTATDNGVWVQLKMPHKILLSSVFLGNGAWHETAPGSFKFYGTNNDTDWTLIQSFTGQTPQGGSSFAINATVAYKTIGLVITHCAGANSY
tara:strand:+ start:163 stop:1209 length:1047 start_codon:yes stop_codon:yes gene_type:complete